jgi:hypothetical protein
LFAEYEEEEKRLDTMKARVDEIEKILRGEKRPGCR